MKSQSETRDNTQWLAALSDQLSPEFAPAVLDLRERLRRAVYFYLLSERSDLANTSEHDLRQLAEDIAQDSTLRVLTNLEHFRGESTFTTWATKIAVRMTISELRRVRYRNFSLDALSARFDEDDAASGAMQDEFILPEQSPQFGNRPQPGPEQSLERSEAIRGVQGALEHSLSERQRQALVAVILQGVPLEVVASRMGMNRNALYKLLHDARRNLRAYMEARGLSLHYLQSLFSG